MNELHIKPVGNKILIKLDPNKGAKKSASGIIYKEAWERPSNIAEILEVGPLVTDFKKGDRVVINCYAVIDLHTSSMDSEDIKNMKIILEENILCKA